MCVLSKASSQQQAVSSEVLGESQVKVPISDCVEGSVCCGGPPRAVPGPAVL